MPGDEIASDNDYAQELAEKVNFLFDTFRKPNGKRVTYREVQAKTGLQPSWISDLTTAKAIRPTFKDLRALSNFFGVRPDFWSNELTDAVQAQAIMDAGPSDVQQIAARASDLSPEARQIILKLIKSLEDSPLESLKSEGKQQKQ